MTYSISDLEQLSGIYAHTIRIWERRYGALSPARSQGNTRLYDDNELRRLLNIVSLIKSGLKISKICLLSDREMNRLLDQEFNPVSDDAHSEYCISQLVKHGIAFDEYSFHRLLDESIDCLGLSTCYRKVIYPLLVRLGLMWRKDDICPAHEHFLANIIRQKIFTHINNLAVQKMTGQKWLLFLPEYEDHDIGLLFASYILRIYQQQVIFLGSKVPLNAIAKVYHTLNVDHVLLFMVKTQPTVKAQQYINQLSAICTSAQIHLAGNNQVIDELKNIDHINRFRTLDEFELSIQSPVLNERNF
ncbi:MerR family transcriptional regulator [Pedobacter sp. HDW13]|nr:MerR family transcriptional regulator [Pedobacter sp. HDW13]RQO73472.1 MerR family transcriptional regulator [Pedobacter sp. KBW01]